MCFCSHLLPILISLLWNHWTDSNSRILIVGVKFDCASVKKNSHGPSVSHLHPYFDKVELYEALVVLEFILVASKNELLIPVD